MTPPLTPPPTWRLLLGLARYAPRLYLAHALLWDAMNASALLPGLIARAFFDALTGRAHPPAGTTGLWAKRPCGSSPAPSRSACGSR